MPIKIKGLRTGRPDYSTDVFIQSIPEPRLPVSAVSYTKTFNNVGPGETVTIEEHFDPSHFIYIIDVSASAIVYLEVRVIIDSTPFPQTGWGRVTIEFPASFPFSDLKVEIVNRSNITLDEINYSHYAVQGVEKIVPRVIPV